MVRVVAAEAAMVVLSTGAAHAATLGSTAAGDALRGTNGADTIRGGGGGDILRGLDGDDRLYGDGGSDGLYGWPGNDHMYGGAGDDRLEDRSVYGGSGLENLYFGPGNDSIFSAGDGYGTVQKGPDANLDRFAGCEKFVWWAPGIGSRPPGTDRRATGARGPRPRFRVRGCSTG